MDKNENAVELAIKEPGHWIYTCNEAKVVHALYFSLLKVIKTCNQWRIQREAKETLYKREREREREGGGFL